MRKILIFSMMFLFAVSCQESEQKKTSVNETPEKETSEIVLKAWAIGPERPSVGRIENLKKAIEIYNREKNANIKLETEFWTGKPVDFRRKFTNAFQVGLAPDILGIGHEEIGRLVNKGHLLDITSYIREDKSGTFADFFPSLWESVRYQEKLYGVPQDTEVRMFYYRKDILKKMGWSEKQIDAFPGRVERGEVTLGDIPRIARKAQKKGLVNWGLYHRPSNGPNFFQFVMANGGRLQDKKTGKLILPKKAVLKALTFLHDLVYRYKVMPREMTTMSWAVMDASIPKGEILFNITGGSWNRSEMIHNEGMSPEEFSEKVGFCLIPAGKKGGRPVSLSHPIVYTVNKDTKHPEIVMEILKIASRSELNLKHALQSSHLAIRREEAAMREYKNQPFLEKATAFLKYTRFLPNHEYYPIYENLFFGAIQSVEMSGVSPEQALRELIAKTRDLIGSEIEIREE